MRDVTCADRELGKRITVERKRADLTISHVAHVIGVSHAQMKKYEDGVNRISATRLVLVADAIDVSIVDLLGIVDTDLANSGLSLDGIRVGRAFDRIGPGILREIIFELLHKIAQDLKGSKP